MRRHLAGAACGIVAAGFGVAVAELLAAATRPEAGPLVAVGGAVIDATPTPVKELAVRELGTHDKPALLAGIVLVLALFAAAVGIVALRYPIAAVTVGAAVFGGAGAGAALSRPAATAFDAVPSLCGALVAGVALAWLTIRIRGGGLVAPRDGSAVAFDRRRFLRAAALVAGGAFVAQGGAGLVKAARGGAADFYRVDTALTVPRIDPDTWSLRIHGMVDRELRLSLPDLLARPLIQRDITLNCVSNEVGGPYAGTARWLGVPLATLLREAAIRPGADQVVARSVDGMTIGTPVATVLDGRDTMLVVGMNGEPLPLTHGFPVRMLTPGLYGYAGACKWLTELELTTFARFDAYWVQRGWSAEGPVKTASRIDVPKPFTRVPAGPVTIAGVAWAQHRGIEAVEVRVDEGPWLRAELLSVPSTDTWVPWRHVWQAGPGLHSIAVRAVDGTGARQPEARSTPFPTGATGWHTTTVTVTEP